MIGPDEKFVTTLPGGGFKYLRIRKAQVVDEELVLGFMVYEEDDGEAGRHLRIYPVTSWQGAIDLDQPCVLMRPSGEIEDGVGEVFASLAEYQTAERERIRTAEIAALANEALCAPPKPALVPS
jgi:hypothetical protein